MVRSVLFVCMGNICRSPSAHGVLRQRLLAAGLDARCRVDSAGTHSHHQGQPPDPRSQAHAQRRGLDLSDLRSRQVQPSDYEQFDLILAMDWDNLALLQADCPPAHQHKLRRLAEFFRQHSDTAVPDPYLGGAAGFERVLDLIEDGCDGLLALLQKPSGERPA